MRTGDNILETRKLQNGARVAVIGGGPAGSFFSYFLLKLAERVDLHLEVDIYEPRDFSLPAPRGCNMCAGVVSETLIQNLAAEGLNLPGSVIQKAFDSYILHTDVGCQQIKAAFLEKRIGAVFRSAGPDGMLGNKLHSFDGHLLSLAGEQGANIVRKRVTGVDRVGENLLVKTRSGANGDYGLLAVAAGVNTAALKLFEGKDTPYRPPKTKKTVLREYFLGQEVIQQHFGDSLHVFLLDIPGIDFAMLIPKGEVVSMCMLGEDIDGASLQAFLNSPEVKSCFPDGWRWDQPVCQCSPRMNIRAAFHPYADRMVFIGDSGATRLYKDGIGTAYRAAKAAAACAVLEGISAGDFRRYYAPFCSRVEQDNSFGRLIFFVTRTIQRVRFARKAVLKMVADEQQLSGNRPLMSDVLWDTFTGSAPYQDVFQRTIQPAFVGRFVRSMVGSVFGS